MNFNPVIATLSRHGYWQGALLIFWLPVIIGLPVFGVAFYQWSLDSYGLPVHKAQRIDFNWRDTDGHERSLAQWQQGYSLLFLGYLNCQDYCPYRLVQLQQIAELANQPGSDQVSSAHSPLQILFISIDSTHDGTEQMAQLVAAHPRLASGYVTTDALNQLSFQLQERVRKQGEEISHMANLYLLNPQRQLIKVYGSTQLSAPAVLADIKQLISSDIAN